MADAVRHAGAQLVGLVPVNLCRDLLLQQLEIPWSLATQYCFPALSDEMVDWAPSHNSLRRGQWPDEQADPIPDATIGWLLWHMEWWWTNAIRGVGDGPLADPHEVPWDRSVAASCTALAGLRDEWVRILSLTDIDRECRWPWESPKPLSDTAAWLNVELTKNVAELGQVVRLHANSR